MHEDAPDHTGPAVRGYRIERLIGTGGAAVVYEARRLGPRGPGGRVACKVMHAEQQEEPCRREQVRQEAVLGLRVTAGHPNLVEILDFFDDAHEQHCMVMELVDGASVAELRGPDRRLPFPVTRRVAVEVLEALVYLHGRGVLHRDLSPRNILVTAGGVVKVADLGNARVMEQGLVHTETLRGTPMYVPREAIERRPLDVRADLFSLGAILYELVTGTPPCGAQKLMGAMFERNAAGKFAPLPPDTPADLATLITGLLPPDRDARRPQTAAEALALLRGHGQPVVSAEELAALVPPAQARRDQEVRHVRPASELPPGYVLVSRDALAPADAPAVPAPGRVAGREAQVMPDRAADAVPYHVSDRLPEIVAERVIDVVVDHVIDAAPSDVIDAAPDHVIDAVPRRVTVSVPGHVIDAAPDHVIDVVVDHVIDAAPSDVIDAAPDHVIDAVPRRVTVSVPGRASAAVGRQRVDAASRTGARRAAIVVTILACVLGFLVHDRHRREQSVSLRQPVTETPLPIPEPAPERPIVPMPVMPERPERPENVVETTESRRSARRTDTLHRERKEGQRGALRSGRARVRGKAVPLGSEPPPWARP